MFRTAAQSLKFSLADGLQIVVRGRISVYELRGEYQILVSHIEPQGAGALQLAFEQLKQKLETEGLFTADAKQALPFLPRGIGIVTSPTGAAIRDILQVLERRFPGLPVLIYPALVQGDQAAREIAEGIETLNDLAESRRIDLLIVGRGGGSVEDLWAFNEEIVARAIYESRIPIISAVGHEIDFTIADFVADLRAPTPSAAAELAVPVREDLADAVESWRERLIRGVENELQWRNDRWRNLRARMGSPESVIQQAIQHVDGFQGRLSQALEYHLNHARQRLQNGRNLLLVYRPDRTAALHRREIRSLQNRLKPALDRYLATHRQRLHAAIELLDSLSPLTVLRRGFGVVYNAKGKILRSVAQVAEGDPISVRLPDGTLHSRVTDVKPIPEEE